MTTTSDTMVDPNAMAQREEVLYDVLDGLQELLRKHRVTGAETVGVLATGLADVLAEQARPEDLDAHIEAVANTVKRLAQHEPEPTH